MDHLINGLARLAGMNSTANNLKKGHMFRGKVISVDKGNEALIKFGQEQVKVHVNQSVAKGASYLFQVENIKPAIELKVVPLPAFPLQGKDLSAMLQKLGIDSSRENKAFLKQILALDTPFQKKEMVQAFRFIESSENKSVSREILLFMLKRRMPVKPSIYQALYTKHSTSFSQILSEFQRQLNHTSDPASYRLLSKIQQMQGESPSSSVQQTTLRLDHEITTGNKRTFDLFKQANIIDVKETYATFQKNWSTGNKEGNQTAMNKASFPVPLEKVAALLKDLFQKQIPLTATDRQSVQQWIYTTEKVINHLKSNNMEAGMSTLSDRLRSQWMGQFDHLVSRKIIDKTFPQLDADTKRMIRNASENLHTPMKNDTIANLSKGDLQSLLHNVRALMQQQVSSDQMRALVEWLGHTSDLVSIPDKDRILHQLKALMDLPGYSDEKRYLSAIKEGKHTIDQENSIKTFLLQTLSDSSEIRPETAKRLLQYINGIQLASHSEDAQSLQLSIQLPGGIIGALSDVEMNMEGRKSKDGDIDPDFCHILFYLELSHLKETVIDMNIIDRRVSVHIFNDHTHLEKLFEPYKSSLDEGLDKIGYELTSVRTSPMKKKNQEHSPAVNEREATINGVDIRI
ncbi:hypothetical protein SAMN04487936_11023 [Halobacillus dabanensis]|uniref:Hook-length control protein FliK n=1 Tax=Halobacillus dabanensis TaxID=240302 RepID=A0A1I3Y3R5_HALDA|nr:hypothetical protein [Halobacillus dabanensis]SFK26478.1 hypothetical protein SAMN04487936_11023 [Halobacillus dabanensis]